MVRASLGFVRKRGMDIRGERGGEDYSWNDREEDRVIEGVAGVRGEVCATRTTGGLCAEVARAGWG